MLRENEQLGGYATSNETENVYVRPPMSDETEDFNINNNNNNNNEIISIDQNEATIGRGTPIENFYAGQSIFITGGTGFLGKVLIEKLLRSCPEISAIYLLIRDKKDKNVEDRIEDLFNDPLYDRLRDVSPKFRHKIVAISGDCSVKGLGLSVADRERLVQEVSIVFHSAATVRFDERLDNAMAINVGSTADMIDLCKRMPRLKAFIHVSTAYANCHVPKIEEMFYTSPADYEELKALIKDKDEREISKITKKILGAWPNTYTFTKALAENVVRQNSDGLNIGIFRPAIVTSSACEPLPGWIDNYYGPTGFVAVAATGMLKTIQCGPWVKANIVPVDFTVNALIASAWDVANQPGRRNSNMMIYNYVATAESSLTWGDFASKNVVYGYEFPLSHAKWSISLRLDNNRVVHLLYRTLLHHVPALLVDFICICTGNKPVLMKTYKKIHKFSNVLSWFCINEWVFTNNNVQGMWKRLDPKDRQKFRFSIKELDWKTYLRNYMKGMRTYLMKDDISTLEASRKKMQKLVMIDATVKAMFYALFFWGAWKSISAVSF